MKLPPLNLTNNILVIDNSRLEQFTTCPRLAEYTVVRKRIPSAERIALSFGGAIHLALKLRYSYYPPGVEINSTDCTQRQWMLLDEVFKDINVPEGDYRTVDYAKEVIRDYNLSRGVETFELIHHEGHHLVEQSFCEPIGKIGDISVVWSGRIDLGIQEAGDVWVLDHKTTKMGGEYLFREYFTSSQMIGYCWALQRILERPVKGAIVDALVCRPPTRTGKGLEFARSAFTYDQEQLDEWVDNTLHIAADFLHNHERGFFPKHTKQCITKYGPCAYIDLCCLNTLTALVQLYTPEFRDDEWTPLREDSVDIASIMEQPLEEGHAPRPTVIRQQEAKAKVSNLLNSLGINDF
jgi:hypothetical protein